MNQKANVSKELNARHKKVPSLIHVKSLKFQEYMFLALVSLDCIRSWDSTYRLFYEPEYAMIDEDLRSVELNYVYACQLWNPQKSWGAHIKGKDTNVGASGVAEENVVVERGRDPFPPAGGKKGGRGQSKSFASLDGRMGHLEIAMGDVGVEEIRQDAAMCKRAIAGGAVVTPSPRVDTPKPKEFGGKRDAKELDNYIWHMERYFEGASITDEKTKGLYTIGTWEVFKKEIKKQFYPENVAYEARKKMKELRHKGSVRSATLDTWLPEQVAFIQSMGNEKANSYWEAELPPYYDRVGIENFIRAKYEDKRWVAKDGKAKSPSRVQEEKPSVQWQRPGDRSGHGYTSDERKNFQAPVAKDSIPATRISIPVPPRGPESVIPAQNTQQKSEPAMPPAEPVKQVAEVISPPKVDFATDLFNMLSMNGPTENGSGETSADDNAWAAAEKDSTAEKTGPSKFSENKAQPTSGIEDLFNDSPLMSDTNMLEKPQKDVKNDIMSLFDKSNMVSPFAMHQQQLALLAQQQSFLMAAAAKSAGGMLKFPSNAQQPGSNGATIPSQNWPNAGYQFPAMVPAAGKIELEKYMPVKHRKFSVLFNEDCLMPHILLYLLLKQMGNMTNLSGNSAMSSIYSMGQNASVNGATPSGVTRPQSASQASSASPVQAGKEYDFSSLTQGMFSKP
ncbi:hypothetical protein RJ639_011835 [Escallonia herrerae]|uniref:Arf-GAP domain-containing protein n=1 Tax=Escallonia herrerae TaxID=1293975 RepID=A0AA88VPH1_9ASTE|nr:hypothetical protein RJ639_011835 [Escallonia herrerae]